MAIPDSYIVHSIGVKGTPEQEHNNRMTHLMEAEGCMREVVRICKGKNLWTDLNPDDPELLKWLRDIKFYVSMYLGA